MNTRRTILCCDTLFAMLILLGDNLHTQAAQTEQPKQVKKQDSRYYIDVNGITCPN